MFRFCRYSLLLCVLAGMAPTLSAQTDVPPAVPSQPEAATPSADSLQAVPGIAFSGSGIQPEMTLPVSPFSPTAYGLHHAGPYGDGIGTHDWSLHQGFNAQFSLDMACGFGKNRMKGVGFGQTAALAYVQPVTSKFSIAAGLYASNWDWGPWHMTDVGISGLLAYQLTERLTVYAFGSKSFMPRQRSFNSAGLCVPAYWMRPDNRFGAAAEYKFSDHFKMGISVERVEY